MAGRKAASGSSVPRGGGFDGEVSGRQEGDHGCKRLNRDGGLQVTGVHGVQCCIDIGGAAGPAPLAAPPTIAMCGAAEGFTVDVRVHTAETRHRG